ncbi:MAG: hypothetical protein ACKV2U_11630 [Bryobacteraceae bacterium]
MTNRLTRFGLALALSASLALADFRYDQSSRMTGGAMMAMMKMAARVSKGAMDPVNSTVAVKGNRMVLNHGKSATIYDLDKETITEVNFEKKEYSVTTFAEMKAFAEKNMSAVSGSNASIEIDVKETGKEEVIGGMKTREFLMSMNVEGTDPQTGKKSEMRMEMSNWMAPKLPGYGEVNNFYRRMGEKMDLSAMFGGVGQTGMGKGMAAAAKKMAGMDGITVLQIARMIPTDPEQLKQMEQAQQQAQQSHPAPSAGQVAEQAAGQAATSAVAGRMGRLGGLGAGGLGGLGGMRKKKQEEAVKAPEAVAAHPEMPPVKGSFSSETSMMEMTSEFKNHSNSTVEEGMFAIPDGFKSVKSAMLK